MFHSADHLCGNLRFSTHLRRAPSVVAFRMRFARGDPNTEALAALGETTVAEQLANLRRPKRRTRISRQGGQRRGLQEAHGWRTRRCCPRASEVRGRRRDGSACVRVEKKTIAAREPSSEQFGTPVDVASHLEHCLGAGSLDLVCVRRFASRLVLGTRCPIVMSKSCEMLLRSCGH